MSAELALAQPEELSSRMVTENSARVWSWRATSPLEFASTVLHETRSENSGGGLVRGVGHFADARDGAGAVLRSGRDCGAIEVRDFLIFLLAEHGKQVGIFGFVAREADCGGKHAAEGFFVGFVGGGAGGAAVHDGADGDAEGVFGYVLVDGVVGEAG